MTTTSISEITSTRNIGPVKATVVSSGQIHFRPPVDNIDEWRTPDTDFDEEGRAVLGIHGMFLETPTAKIVVDPNSWVPPHGIASALLVPGRPIEDALEAAGFDPLGASQVVISHGHADHFTALLDGSGKPRFPNAEHLFPAQDWQAMIVENTNGRADELLEVLGPVEQAGLIRLVDGDTEVSPGVTLLHTGGETDGHQILRVDTAEERLYYLADLVHLPAEVINLDWAFSRGRDVAALETARRRIFTEAQEKPSTVVYTHSRFPAWGTIQPEGAGWRWRYDQQ